MSCASRSWRSANCGKDATIAHMTTVASRDLRNHTADVLRQVADGTRVTITVNGKPVAEISPVRASRPQFFAKADLVGLIAARQADAGLSGDLEILAGDMTDDLGTL
jgi:prevent-host-death family protein